MIAKYFIMLSLLFFDAFGVGFYFAKIVSHEKQILNSRKEVDDFVKEFKSKNVN